jgi:hypothetical protein
MTDRKLEDCFSPEQIAGIKRVMEHSDRCKFNCRTAKENFLAGFEAGWLHGPIWHAGPEEAWSTYKQEQKDGQETKD